MKSSGRRHSVASTECRRHESFSVAWPVGHRQGSSHFCVVMTPTSGDHLQVQGDGRAGDARHRGRRRCDGRARIRAGWPTAESRRAEIRVDGADIARRRETRDRSSTFCHANEPTTHATSLQRDAA